MRVARSLFIATAVCFCVIATPARVCCAESAQDEPTWIWTPDHPVGKVPQTSCHFRKTIHVADAPQTGVVEIAADDIYELFVNGKKIARGSTQQEFNRHEVQAQLRQGKNVFAIKVTNRNGDNAGLAARITLDAGTDKARVYVTNPTWRCSQKALPLWTSVTYRDERWTAAKNLGAFGTKLPWEKPAKRRGLLSVVQKEAPTSDAPKKRFAR